MATSNPQPTPADANCLIFPRDPSIGTLGAFAKESRTEEIKDLEKARVLRIWEARAVISDTVPLAGDAAQAMSRPSHHLFYLNESPLLIYVHEGGHRAVYYELVSDENRKLAYIAVRVETRLPSNALLLARRPINVLLDLLTRDLSLPILVQRLELMSPRDGGVLMTEMLLPARNGVIFGPLGGILQAPPFAPYDALYREEITNPSPFYRLLCAWKMYEGTNRLRRWLHQRCVERHITDRLPPDPDIDPEELVRMGLERSAVAGMKKAADLFRMLGDHRDAIAHFLIERDGDESHVYLAEGRNLTMYAIGASVLLRYAHRILEELRLFYINHPVGHLGASILPLPQNRDQFVVRAADHGLE